jgi:transmembrane 9 superfamily protein 2/4
MEQVEAPGALIVGFEIKAMSIDHQFEGKWNDKCVETNTCELFTCDPNTGPEPTAPKLVLKPHKKMDVVFTYDVLWVHSDVKWASRWDVYLQMQWQDDEIHWFSIVNSSVILLFLSGMVAMIMLRILRKDLYRYNQLDQSEEAREEAREETGWKLVYGDVFRPPKHASLLAVFIGSGVQILGMSVCTIIFAVFGFLSPSNRGSLLLVMILFFVFMGMPAGYVSAIFCKMFKGAGTDRLKNTLMTAMVFPGVVFAIFFALNLMIWGDQGTGAVPFGTLVALLLFWFGLSLPLVFLGSFLGFRRDAIEPPVRVNAIPRQIPEQVWYMRSVPSVLMGGVLPFGVVFVELFFILSSIWDHRFYYLFGFMLLVLIILIVTCAQITIVMAYFQLCSEDYHWWWRAYFTSGASAFYLFGYAAYYLLTRVHVAKRMQVASYFIFFGYMTIFSYAFFVLTGFVGFISCFFFVRTIYASIKID